MNASRLPGILPKLIVAFALAASGLSNPAPAAESVRLRVHWIDSETENRIRVSGLIVAAHDGSLDFYDHTRPLSTGVIEPLRMLIRSGISAQLLSMLTQTYDGQIRGIYTLPFIRLVGTPPPLYPGRSPIQLIVDPSRHRYFSFVGSVKPSDDAFFGNEDPLQYELFDEAGRFRGPFLIDVYGNQVMDAGLCANNETGIGLLDPPLPPPGAGPCQGGEGLVAPHPGLNGSHRNPDGEPRRVLGGSFAHHSGTTLHYGLDTADFSRPGYRLGRLLVAREGWVGQHVAGSWYNPERAGEGFNIEWIEPGADSETGSPRFIVNWYTYETLSNGRQAWLAGMGEMGQNGISVPLHRTRGGRFASTSNPTTVERHPWGHATFSFTSCNEGEVHYTTRDSGWPPGSYRIHRLGPLPEILALECELFMAD